MNQTHATFRYFSRGAWFACLIGMLYLNMLMALDSRFAHREIEPSSQNIEKKMLIRLTAAAVARDDDKYLLVEERAQGSVVLNNPSGRCEAGELHAATAIREAAEEARVMFIREHDMSSERPRSLALMCFRKFSIAFVSRAL